MSWINNGNRVSVPISIHSKIAKTGSETRKIEGVGLRTALLASSGAPCLQMFIQKEKKKKQEQKIENRQRKFRKDLIIYIVIRRNYRLGQKMKNQNARLLRYFAIRTSTECFGWPKWTDFSSLTPEHTGIFEGKTCSSDKICQKTLFKCTLGIFLNFPFKKKSVILLRKKIRENILQLKIRTSLKLISYCSIWNNISN